MWAIVEIAKKQYKIKEGDVLQVERLKGEDSLTFDKVLMLSDEGKVTVGMPYLAGAEVKAEILKEEKGDKVIVYKCKRRQKYRKKIGHRQIHTFLKISQISRQ